MLEASRVPSPKGVGKGGGLGDREAHALCPHSAGCSMRAGFPPPEGEGKGGGLGDQEVTAFRTHSARGLDASKVPSPERGRDREGGLVIKRPTAGLGAALG
jgi:hypothetical protein